MEKKSPENAVDDFKKAVWHEVEPTLAWLCRLTQRGLDTLKKWRDKFTDYCLESLPMGLLIAALYGIMILLMVHHG